MLVGKRIALTRQIARSGCWNRMMMKEETGRDPPLQAVGKFTTDTGQVSVCVGQI